MNSMNRWAGYINSLDQLTPEQMSEKWKNWHKTLAEKAKLSPKPQPIATKEGNVDQFKPEAVLDNGSSAVDLTKSTQPEPSSSGLTTVKSVVPNNQTVARTRKRRIAIDEIINSHLANRPERSSNKRKKFVPVRFMKSDKTCSVTNTSKINQPYSKSK